MRAEPSNRILVHWSSIFRLDALRHADGLGATRWPASDAEVAKAEELEIPVQVNGKLRGVVKVPPTVTDAELEKIALADANVQSHIAGKTVKKVVIVKSRLVSIVV